MNRSRPSRPPARMKAPRSVADRKPDACKPQSPSHFHNQVWDALLSDDDWDEAQPDRGDFWIEDDR